MAITIARSSQSLNHVISASPCRDMLADRGYDADWFREALEDKDIKPCIPPKKNRKQDIEYDKILYKQRNKIEIMFGRLVV